MRSEEWNAECDGALQYFVKYQSLLRGTKNSGTYCSILKRTFAQSFHFLSPIAGALSPIAVVSEYFDPLEQIAVHRKPFKFISAVNFIDRSLPSVFCIV
jgi:hypothetical protein